MLLNVDIMNFLLKKTKGGDTERLILFYWFGVLWFSAGRWWRLGAQIFIQSRLKTHLLCTCNIL